MHVLHAPHCIHGSLPHTREYWHRDENEGLEAELGLYKVFDGIPMKTNSLENSDKKNSIRKSVRNNDWFVTDICPLEKSVRLNFVSKHDLFL